MPSQVERRKHPRFLTDLPVDYSVGAHHGSGRLHDISLGGVGLDASHRLLRKGTQARISIEEEGDTLEFDVIICRKQDNRLGAFFLPLRGAQRAALERFLARLPRSSTHA
jgi:hypothetical protein